MWRNQVFDALAKPHLSLVAENYTERVYVVVDSGLSRGAQAAQAIHAVAELAFEFPEWHRNWINCGNVIIVLETENIMKTILTAMPFVHGYTIFREPDFDWAVTAFAVFDNASSLDSPGFYHEPWRDGPLSTSLDVRGMLNDLLLMGSKPRSKRQERKLQAKENKQRKINR